MSLVLCSVLVSLVAAAAPEVSAGSVPVQRPVAPQAVDSGEVASPPVAELEPAPAAEEPAPELEPEPAVETTAAWPVTDRETSAILVGGSEPWKKDYVRVRRPRHRGTGLMITAGSLFASAFVFQAAEAVLCGDCASGLLERGFIGSAALLAPIGAGLRGRRDAYDDAAFRRSPRRTKATIASGLTLAAVGAIGGLTNEVFWWRCWRDDQGPYATDGGCRSGASRAVLDLSAMALTAGVSMATWGIKYRRDSKKYRRARITVAPQVSSTHVGLSLSGRF